MTVIQKLQAVHSLRQPAQLSQQSTVSTKQTVALTTSQAAAAVAAGAVTMATGGGESPGNITAQKAAQIVQGSFPQGSILVVPHPTHPFHAVLPVFANTAVLMPQAAATVSTATTNSTSLAAVSHTAAGPTVSVAVAEKRTNDKQLVAGAVPGESDASKIYVSPASYPVATATAGSTAQTILVQTPSGSTQPISAIQVSPSSVIQLSSGSRNNVPAGMMVSSERVKESLSGSKERLPSSSTPSKEKPPESEVSPRPHQQPPQKGGLAAALSSQQTATIALHPSLIPQALASGMLTAVQGGGVKFQDYRQALALSGVPVMPVMPVKVGEPVKLSTIDFESQSIEITGEVPIKKVEVDSKTGEFIPVPLTAVAEPPSDRERMVTESEKSGPTLTSKEADKSLSVSKVQKTTEEDDSQVDVEGESKQVRAAKSPAKVSREEKGGAFSGHTSSDILSAQLLLALTDGHRKDWTSGVPPSTEPQKEEKSKTGSPVKALLSREASIVLTPVPLMKTSSRDETASPASSTSQTAVSGGRKRKQKPIASAKPDDKEVESTAKTTPTPRGRKGARKVKQVAEEEHVVETTKSSAKKKQVNDKTAEKETPVKSKQLSPEELLVLLDIPPSGGKASAKNKTPISKPKGKTKDKPNQDGRSVLQSSNATANAKMEELKATRAEKPMKEYVIETDSDSDSSSSATSSSRFSPDSGSSSESSSDSSSDEGGGGEGERGEGSETKVKPLTKKVPVRATKVGVDRGRGISGRGGRVQRKGKKEASSSADSSSEEEEGAEETGQSKKKPTRGGRRGVTRSAARGGARSSGRGGRAAQQENKQEKRQRGHIVSIPTNLLTHKPQTGKKRKAVSREVHVHVTTITICRLR